MGRHKVCGVIQGRRPSEAKEQFWRDHLESQHAGGLSIRDYCGRHGLAEPSFYAWRREITRRDYARSRVNCGRSNRNGAGICSAAGRRAAGFVRLELQSASSGPAAPIEIVLPEGPRVLVPPGATRDQLREVLAALQAASAAGGRPC